MADKDISIEELTEKRTPPDLLRWVEWKTKQIESTEEGERALRLHEGLAKQLMEEVYPLAIFGQRKFGDTDRVLLQPIIGDQSYDAVLTDLRSDPAHQSYLEITQSHEGENDYLRRRVLETRIVIMPDHMTKTGTKRTGLKVFSRPNANSGEVAPNELERIYLAAERKAAKNYPADTSLIIVFHDDHFFRRHIDDARLDTFVRKYILKLDLRFSNLYLVGWQSMFREFNLVKRN